METDIAMTRTELCALIRSRQQGITAVVRLHYFADAIKRGPEVQAACKAAIRTWIPLSHAAAQEIVQRMLTDGDETAGLRIRVSTTGHGNQRVIWIG